MTDHDPVALELREFGRSLGMTRKSNSWYLRGTQVTIVLNLQKSIYSGQRYLNVAFWLNALGDEPFPRESKCHIRLRLDSLLDDQEARIAALLNPEEPIADSDRRAQVREILNARLRPFLEQMATLAGIKEVLTRGTLRHAAIQGAARAVIERGAKENSAAGSRL